MVIERLIPESACLTCFICFNRIPEDGTPVPKCVRVDIHHEFYFMILISFILLSAFIRYVSQLIICWVTIHDHLLPPSFKSLQLLGEEFNL
jgi:hypothetical protein